MRKVVILAMLLLIAIAVAPATAQTFDNSGGGTWKECMSFPITVSPTEYAQYKIVINGTTWELYNESGTLESSGTNNKFWGLVNSSGADIRVFNQTGAQLYFWIEYINATEQKAIIWVNLSAGSSELNIAYGNPIASSSTYINFEKVFELFRYDSFDTLDTAFWTHREGGSVGTSTDTYVSSPSSLKLYYGTDRPWHADAGGSLPARTFWIMEFWWKNSGTDTSPDPDRGGGSLLTGGAHGTGVIGVTVSPNKIGYTGGVTETGSFSNVWLHFRYVYDNGEKFLYRDVNGEWVLKSHVVDTPVTIDTVKFAISGYYHAEYADDLYLYTTKDVDPADFGTPIVKLFQKQFGTKTVYVNVTYLDTATTNRYNPIAYYKLEDKPQINVSSDLSISGVNATYGANISIELINFVTLDKVVYNGTDVTVNLTYQGTKTNATTGYVYNVYNFTTYENGTLEIYGHVANKAYETTYKLDGETVDIFNVTAVIGEPIEIILPHKGNVTVASLEHIGVASAVINTKDLGVGAKTLSITIDDPENFTIGYKYGTINIAYGNLNVVVRHKDLTPFTNAIVSSYNDYYGILSTDMNKLYAKDNTISVFFHGVKLKSVSFYLNHSTNGATITIDTNSTRFTDYRGINRTIASPNSFDVVNLSADYPYSVIGIYNYSGTVVIDFEANPPTAVDVKGADFVEYIAPVLKFSGSGNATVTDLYKLTVPIKDRLGNPVNFYITINGSRVDASNGKVTKNLVPSKYLLTYPEDIGGFKFYKMEESKMFKVIPAGRGDVGSEWRYTTSSPPTGWNTELDFNDSTWNIGYTPIGDTGNYRTYLDLNGGNLYARHKFNLTEIIHKAYPALNLSEWNITVVKATLYGEVDDELWVWLNGVQVMYAKISGNYWDGIADVTPYINIGDNLVAVRVYDSGAGSNFFDLMLEITVKLENANRTITAEVEEDSPIPPAEYRVPTVIESRGVRIESIFDWLPIPFLSPKQEENITVVRLEGSLKDFYGAPVIGRTIKIEVASPNSTRVYNITTDSSGNFKFEVDIVKGIEYKVTYTFEGDDVYVETSTSKTFLVEQLLPAPPAPEVPSLAIILVIGAVGAGVIVAIVYMARRRTEVARTRIEQEFRFFRRLK